MKVKPTDQKLRGGYYTPAVVAEFLAAWAIQSDSARVLEPSCGDGAMLSTALARLRALGAKEFSIVQCVLGVEIDEGEAEKARARIGANDRLLRDCVKTQDFFSVCHAMLVKGQRFDAVLGNPPFIRYQEFAESNGRSRSKLWNVLVCTQIG